MTKNKKNPYTPEELILKTARKFGVPAELVRREIESGIRMGLFSRDPKEREKMNAVPREGEMPTPEELIAYLIKEMERGN